MKTLFTISIFFILSVANLFSQKELYNWFLNIGIISFSDKGENPKYIEPNFSPIVAEGSASISDKEGNLLFYTNGTTVWNSEHQIMDNGDKIQGSRSVAMSSLIVKKPLSENIYYLFVINDNYDKATSGDSSNYYCYYNIIDMKANSGLGKVLVKNVILNSDDMSEIQHAVLNDDCKSSTIFFHSFSNDELIVYDLNNSGLKTNPKYTIKNFTSVKDDIYGDIKYNTKYNLIAFANSLLWKNVVQIQIYTYNKDSIEFVQSLGEVTTKHSTCQIAFSPDGEKLYLSLNGIGEKRLIQYANNKKKTNRFFTL